MKIDVTAALNKPGYAIKFEKEKTYDSVLVAGDDIEFISPVEVFGTIMFTGKDYIVKGEILVQYDTICGRCLTRLSGELKIDFYEEFSKTEDEDHPDRYLFENNEIDLEDMVLDNISLAMPMKHLCEENCKGLCMICGNNLNTGDCDCISNEKYNSSSFAKIKELSLEDEDIGGVGNGSTKEKNI